MWFSKICKSSRIRLRAAVLKYLKYCEEKKLVHGDEKWLKIRDGRGDRKTVRCLKVYSITIKGEMLLEWLK